MTKIYAIGIGAGNIEQLTLEAIAALNAVDVFLVADKGEAKAELVAFRERVCERFIDANHDYQFITVEDPKRGPDAERNSAEYLEGVRAWHQARTENYVRIINDVTASNPEATFGFLVWGDPAFYDSTLRIIDQIVARLRETSDTTELSGGTSNGNTSDLGTSNGNTSGLGTSNGNTSDLGTSNGNTSGLGTSNVELTVIPGISAPQLLAAAHKIPLNRVGTSIHITTGRRLVEEYQPALGDVIVMLDGHLACQELVAQYPDLTLYWGAYLGCENQTLRSGRLAEILPEVTELRAELRERYGWLMDTYLLRP